MKEIVGTSRHRKQTPFLMFCFSFEDVSSGQISVGVTFPSVATLVRQDKNGRRVGEREREREKGDLFCLSSGPRSFISDQIYLMTGI